MGCFSVHNFKKRQGTEQVPKSDADRGGESISPSAGRRVLSAPPSFKGSVRVIQHAQRFVNRNRVNTEEVFLRSSSPPPPVAPTVLAGPPSPLGGRAGLGSSIFDIAATYSSKAAMENTKPMPLPSPKRSGYPLPHPSEHAEYTSSRILPLDGHPTPGSFSYNELAAACCNFAPDSCIEDEGVASLFAGRVKLRNGATEVTQDVVALRILENWTESSKECVSDILWPQGPYLCKLLGYHAVHDSTERILVYEALHRGGLHNLLFKVSGSVALDWHCRIKVAVGAAQGLSRLLETYPDQVMYTSFKVSHIQVDFDYSSKILGYGVPSNPNYDSWPTNQRANAYCAPETVTWGEVSAKSLVWSYGIVLLELLSGRKNLDDRAMTEGKDTLVKWAHPFLMDEGRLFLMMDPKLQGRFPAKGSKLMADLILQCLQKDPVKRPDMSRVLDVVKSVHEMRYANRSTFREADNDTNNTSMLTAKTSMLYEHRQSSQSQPKFEIENPRLQPLIIPAHMCGYIVEESGRCQPGFYSSAPLHHVQGF